MISEKMVTLGTKKSVIREIFEYSKKRAAEIGSENVFDFSIGNPNVPAPASVHETIKELLDSKDDYYLFGYTSAQGDADTRAAVAADLNKRFGTAFHADNFYMTCGAAASLRIVLGALTVPGDEYIVFTPYFPEYRVFIESAGAAMIASGLLALAAAAKMAKNAGIASGYNSNLSNITGVNPLGANALPNGSADG